MTPSVTTTGGVNQVLPLYQCHKQVRACRITTIEQVAPARFVVHPEEKFLDSFEVPAAFVQKHQPQPGGWIVQYADGYLSFSPHKAFEDGYERVDDLIERREELTAELQLVNAAIDAAKKGA